MDEDFEGLNLNNMQEISIPDYYDDAGFAEAVAEFDQLGIFEDVVNETLKRNMEDNTETV